MLIRQQLNTFVELVKEYRLSFQLIKSDHNQEEKLISLLQHWLDAKKKHLCVALCESLTLSLIMATHHQSDHPRVRHIWYIVHQVSLCQIVLLVVKCVKHVSPSPYDGNVVR